MRIISLVTVIFLALASVACAVEEGFTEMFNGKDLSGWEGVEGLWSVEDGVIVGKTTAEKKAKTNTFLIWRGGEVEDCELRFDVRLPSNNTNNSGIMYRAKELTDKNYFVMSGYQCDLQTGWEHFGKMYDEKGRGRICMCGQKVEVPVGCKSMGQKVLGESAPLDQVKAAEKKGDWNSFVILAKGNHVQHILNGVVVLDLTDLDDKVRSVKGLIGLQIHAGSPMHIEFRNLRVKRL